MTISQQTIDDLAGLTRDLGVAPAWQAVHRVLCELVCEVQRLDKLPSGDAPPQADDSEEDEDDRYYSLADAVRAAMHDFEDEYSHGPLVAAWDGMGRTSRTMASQQIARRTMGHLDPDLRVRVEAAFEGGDAPQEPNQRAWTSNGVMMFGNKVEGIGTRFSLRYEVVDGDLVANADDQERIGAALIEAYAIEASRPPGAPGLGELPPGWAADPDHGNRVVADGVEVTIFDGGVRVDADGSRTVPIEVIDWLLAKLACRSRPPGGAEPGLREAIVALADEIDLTGENELGISDDEMVDRLRALASEGAAPPSEPDDLGGCTCTPVTPACDCPLHGAVASVDAAAAKHRAEMHLHLAAERVALARMIAGTPEENVLDLAGMRSRLEEIDEMLAHIDCAKTSGNITEFIISAKSLINCSKKAAFRAHPCRNTSTMTDAEYERVKGQSVAELADALTVDQLRAALLLGCTRGARAPDDGLRERVEMVASSLAKLARESSDRADGLAVDDRNGHYVGERVRALVLSDAAHAVRAALEGGS